MTAAESTESAPGTPTHTPGPMEHELRDYQWIIPEYRRQELLVKAREQDSIRAELLAALETVHRVAGLGSPPQMSADTLQAALIDIRSITEAALARAQGQQ